jgi:DNA-binding NarL/FixJ family response regulator
MEDMFHGFAEKAKLLSPAERRILNYYIDGYDVADVPELAFVSIHTVKKHNRSIYQKLEIASRDELMLYIELFRRCDRLEELTGNPTETE